jgi:hypothetical protein
MDSVDRGVAQDGVSRLDLAHHDDRAALSEPCPITAAERVTD